MNPLLKTVLPGLWADLHKLGGRVEGDPRGVLEGLFFERSTGTHVYGTHASTGTRVYGTHASTDTHASTGTNLLVENEILLRSAANFWNVGTG